MCSTLFFCPRVYENTRPDKPEYMCPPENTRLLRMKEAGAPGGETDPASYPVNPFHIADGIFSNVGNCWLCPVRICLSYPFFN